MSNTMMLIGSVCLTDLVEQAKKGHSAFFRGTNNKVYVNVLQFISDEPNQYGQHSQLLLNPKPDAEKDKCYIGNLKKAAKKEPEPITPESLEENITEFEDDLPF